MKKIVLLLFVVMSLFLSSCGNESDVLATYKDGDKNVEVTRGEFYKHLGGRKKMALSSKRRQAGYLEKFVLDMIKVSEAKKLGYDKDPSYKKQVKDYLEKKLLINVLFKEKFPRKGLKYSVDGHKIRHIIIKSEKFKTVIKLDPSRFTKMAAARKVIKDPTTLKKRLAQLKNLKKSSRVKLSKAELKAQEKANSTKIAQILKELQDQGGKNFNALATKYSQDGTKKNGGLLGYVVYKQKDLDKTFLAEALKLKAGEVSGVIKTKFGFHIIKCDEIVKITDKNIGDLEKDKRKLGRMQRNIWYSVVWKFIDSTLKDKNVKQDLAVLKSNDKKAVLFAIDSKDFKYKLTLGEFVKIMKSMPPRKLSRYGIKRSLKDKNKKFTPKELKSYYDWYVTYPILRYGAYVSGAVKTQFFKDSVSKIEPQMLVSVATKKIGDKIAITEADLKAEYKKNKKNYRKRIANPKGSKKKFRYQQLSYAKAKKQIETGLKRSVVRKQVSQWVSSLKKKYDYKVFLGELEVVKPKARPNARQRRASRRRMPIRTKKK